MSVETRKVLEMLTEGKITAADAERILDKLSSTADVAAELPPASAVGATNAGATNVGATKKFLRVIVEKPSGNDVNVRVPLNFVRSGVKIASLLPPKVLARLQEEGIDPALFNEPTQQMVDELNIDMQTAWGKHIRVFCE